MVKIKRTISIIITLGILISVGSTVMADGVLPRNAGVCPRCNISTTISTWEQMDDGGFSGCVAGLGHMDLKFCYNRYFTEKCPKPGCGYESNNKTTISTTFVCPPYVR